MGAPTDVFLDVDGVLNAVTPWTPEWDWDCSPERRGIAGFGICWAPPLIERLNALAARPHVQFHWLTTWLDDAPRKLCSQIGLNGSDWPVIGHQEYLAVRQGWWKLPAIQGSVREGHRVVWIDDDLIDTTAREWAKTLGPQIMLVQPNPHVGLTQQMVEFIQAWIEDSP